MHIMVLFIIIRYVDIVDPTMNPDPAAPNTSPMKNDWFMMSVVLPCIYPIIPALTLFEYKYSEKFTLEKVNTPFCSAVWENPNEFDEKESI